MLIKVLYGDNKLLLCNSTCSVVNLIRYIQNKTGFTVKNIDLADETGLVVQLSAHPTEYADKYAASGTYILVEKQLRPDSGKVSPKKNQDPYTYTSLLENYEELFPNLVDFHTASQKLARKERKDKLLSPTNKLLSPASATKSKAASPQRSTKSPAKKKSSSRPTT